MTRRTTMKDVADYAGVSTATVARYIHQNGYVSDEAAQRVAEAITATHYNLNTVAQSLRQQRTYILGHILQSIVPNPFFAQVSLGVEQYAQEQGYNVLVVNVQGESRAETQAVQTLIGRRVDALLFTAPMDAQNVRLAMDAGITVIQVERPRLAEANQVLVDNYTGTIAAMNHLIAQGHTRIAFISAKLDGDEKIYSYVEHERMAGYVDALEQHGLPVNRNLIAFGSLYYVEKGGSAGDGLRLAHHVLDQTPRPTAILAGSDMFATGALQAIYARRLRIPDDISIIGFDDTYAAYLAPPLSTVRLPMIEMGHAAARMAINEIEMETRKPASYSTERLVTQFIVRDSTGPAPTG